MAALGLTQEQRNFYDENGYILIKNVFSKTEMSSIRAELHDLIERLAKIREVDATWETARNQGTKIYHCHDVQFQLASVSRLIVDPRLTSLMAGSIGPNVQLHHTKMFIKPPENGSPFPMHQDYPYFPHERHTMAAAIIHFDESTVAKGCFRVVPGSHKLGPIAPDNPKDYSLSMKKYPVDSALPCLAEPGDVVLFNYLTIHGSGVNVSNEARTTLLVQFRDPTDRPTTKTHESNGQGMMLAGIDPACANLPKWEKIQQTAKEAVAL